MRIQRGFTLIEIMVALTILAIALTAIVSTASTSATQLKYIEEKTTSHWVAANALARLHAGLLTIPTGGRPLSGTETQLNSTWQWQMRFSRTENDLITLVTIDVISPYNNAVYATLYDYIMPELQ